MRGAKAPEVGASSTTVRAVPCLRHCLAAATPPAASTAPPSGRFLVNRATTYSPIREPPAMGAVEILIDPTLSPLSSGPRSPGRPAQHRRPPARAYGTRVP